ncbi:MAG: hypothetical protein CMO55_06135 [Verrucomicrobiales bacterium]|nr:hypothetical protein [Verrucomicrobiales bacterium]
MNRSNHPDKEGSGHIESIFSELVAVQEALVSGDRSVLESATVQLDECESALMGLREDPPLRWSEAATAMATARGHVERALGNLEGADDSYRSALEFLEEAGLSEEDYRFRRSNLHTYRGLTKLSGTSKEDWEEAISQFDQSIRLREQVDEPGKEQKWGLSAAWINRGDALARMDDESRAEEALFSFEVAARYLAEFDLNESPSFRTRLALCHLNAAETLVQLTTRFGKKYGERAMEEYSKAAEVLRPGCEGGSKESCRVLGVVLTNACRARLACLPEDLTASERDAREAMALADEYEDDDLEMVVLDVTAHTTLAMVLYSRFDETEDCSAITDVVEEGLDRAGKFLEANFKETTLDPIIGELFRYGALTYGRAQPHFLSDYLLDYLDPEREGISFDRSPACHEVAVQVLWQVLADIERQGFTGMGTPEFDRRMELRIDLNRCRERLAEIRSVRFTNE